MVSPQKRKCGHRDRHTQREMPRDDEGRDGGCFYKQWTPTMASKPPEAGREARDSISLTPSEGANPAHTVTLGLQPSEPSEAGAFLLSGLLPVGLCLQPQQTDALWRWSLRAVSPRGVDTPLLFLSFPRCAPVTAASTS